MSFFHLHNFLISWPTAPSFTVSCSNDHPPEDDKDVDYLEEDEDPTNKEEEIQGVEKAAPQDMEADTPQPRPLHPKLQRPKPSQC